jgi:hypothetical protein
MLHNLKHFLTKTYTLLSIGLFVFTYSALRVGAIYYPTDNITNPTCAPGDVGCYVSLLPDQTAKSGALLFSNGTNSVWTTPSALNWNSTNRKLTINGLDITGTSSSFFVGSNAGLNATNATHSNFLGNQSGNSATNANNSNFFGLYAGSGAVSASYSNFFGNGAGLGATNASYSNLFVQNAGVYATNASYSNFFGYNAGGSLFPGNNIGSNNIIIGTNISLGNGIADSMNIGGVLFGTGFYNTTTGSPSITPVSGGRIGIANNTPLYTLHVGSPSLSGIVSRFQNSTGTCDINPTTTSLSCSSDRTLKTNITNLNNTILNQITTLQPVTYTWINDTTNQQQTGFIAQDVEAIFPSLVSTDPTTNLKSLNYIGLIPYTIEGIKELDIKLNQLSSLDTTLAGSFAFLLKEVLGTVSNGINELYVKVVKSDKIQTKEFCTSSGQCLNEKELEFMIQEFKNNYQSQNITPEITPEPTPSPDPVVESTSEIELTPNPEPII